MYAYFLRCPYDGSYIEIHLVTRIKIEVVLDNRYKINLYTSDNDNQCVTYGVYDTRQIAKEVASELVENLNYRSR